MDRKRKLYAILKQPRESDGVTTVLLSQDVEKDAKKAKMSVNKYVEKTKKANPQFKKVYIV